MIVVIYLKENKVTTECFTMMSTLCKELELPYDKIRRKPFLLGFEMIKTPAGPVFIFPQAELKKGEGGNIDNLKIKSKK
jgi:hypothetical protein